MKKSSSDLPAARAMAKQVVITNNLTAPPTPVSFLLEKEGFSVCPVEFEDQIIIAGFFDLDKLQIMLNDMDDPAVQNLTCARVLGHWLLHQEELFEIPELKIIYHQSLGGNVKNFYEKEALYFALHVLFPEMWICKDLHLTDQALSFKYQVPEFLVPMIREAYHK